MHRDSEAVLVLGNENLESWQATRGTENRVIHALWFRCLIRWNPAKRWLQLFQEAGVMGKRAGLAGWKRTARLMTARGC